MTDQQLEEKQWQEPFQAWGRGKKRAIARQHQTIQAQSNRSLQVERTG
ncbi:MAG: hypothetical protein F6K65_44235 [Moorea sp. SIO3C2]|nr:hypothetical protein [Moorena sp. SIO3C2]